MQRTVIKRDGSKEKFETQKIINAIFEILVGLDVADDYEIVFRIMKELDLKIPKEVKTEEIDELLLQAIEQLIPQHPRYDRLATRQLSQQINKRIDQKLGGFREYLVYEISQDMVIEVVRDFGLVILYT